MSVVIAEAGPEPDSPGHTLAHVSKNENIQIYPLLNRLETSHPDDPMIDRAHRTDPPGIQLRAPRRFRYLSRERKG